MLLAVLLTAAIVPGGAFHDSLNFIVAPMAKQCFYEEFADTNAVKTIDVFVQSGGLHAIEMQISGPLSVEDVRQVRYISLPCFVASYLSIPRCLTVISRTLQFRRL